MSGKDIIVVGLQPWDIAIGSNCKNIALEFSKTNRVLYVNRALDRITYLKPKKDALAKRRLASIRGRQKDLSEVKEHLFVLDPKVIVESINWIKSPRLFDKLNYLNNKRLARVVKEAADRLGFQHPIIFIDNDFIRYQYFPELYDSAEGVIYYIRDYLTALPYFKIHGPRLEAGLMKKSAIVTANSSYLAEYAAKNNPRSTDIGQGCELEEFLVTDLPVPEDMKQFSNGPVIGYTGALVSYRLDQELIYQVATANPGWNIVLIGPEDDAFRNGTLHQVSNIFFLGPKPGSALPAYINRFNVCINPQLVTEITIGNYPRKIDEYLAAGKPVVATRTPAMRMFSQFVYLCENAAEYGLAIEKALTENDPRLAEERRNFALGHTWSNSVQKLYEAYDQR